MCTQAIIIKSLSIFIHYQNRSDYLPKKPNKNDLLKRVLNNASTKIGNGNVNDANRANRTRATNATTYNSNNNNNNNNMNVNVNINENNNECVDDDYANAAAPPCTRACTLFCYYVTRQFEEAK